MSTTFDIHPDMDELIAAKRQVAQTTDPREMRTAWNGYGARLARARPAGIAVRDTGVVPDPWIPADRAKGAFAMARTHPPYAPEHRSTGAPEHRRQMVELVRSAGKLASEPASYGVRRIAVR